MLWSRLLALALVSAVAATSSGAPLNLQKPDVNIATDYYLYYDAALGQNVTVFNAYRINSVLAWGLPGDNAASPGGETGFIINQFGQSSGYILRYCVEVLLPQGAGMEQLEHGNTDAFASYECCNGGSCSNCGYQGSGTNPNPNMVGRSYNLDKPYFATNMAKEYGWWYSFNNAGACNDNTKPLGHNGCTYKASPYVDVVKLQDINTLPGWTNSPSDMAQFQTINNIMVNSFDSSLMSSFTYNPAANAYTLLAGKFQADPSNRCAVRCTLGTYSATGLLDAFSKNGNCAPCPQGTYADKIGSTSCTACPAGLSTNGDGATSPAACFSATTPACNPGTFNQYTGHQPCTPCGAGTYQPAHSAQSCIACPQFTSSSAIGASSATSCQLNPPQAQMLFSYSATSTAASDIGGQILADVNGEVGFLQTSSYGVTVSTGGTVSLRCVESVNVTFGTSNCWGPYCYNPSGSSATSNIPTTGPSSVYSNPAGYSSNEGRWFSFPAHGECGNSNLPGQGGCTWKASTVLLESNLGALVNSSFYSCQATNSFGYCWGQLTQQQWNNSTYILENFADYAKLASTISTSSSTVLGPVSVQNGRCVVDCPAGYTFRSAFTAPYCVPSSSSSSSSSASSFLASDVDVEAQNTDSAQAGHVAAIVGGSVAAVALVAIAVALVAYRIRRNRDQLII